VCAAVLTPTTQLPLTILPTSSSIQHDSSSSSSTTTTSSSLRLLFPFFQPHTLVLINSPFRLGRLSHPLAINHRISSTGWTITIPTTCPLPTSSILFLFWLRATSLQSFNLLHLAVTPVTELVSSWSRFLCHFLPQSCRHYCLCYCCCAQLSPSQK
jgi:hypothetical protein